METSLVLGEECLSSNILQQSEVPIESNDTQNEAIITGAEGSATVENVDMTFLDLFEQNNVSLNEKQNIFIKVYLPQII